MNRWSTLQARWYVLVLAVLLALAPTTSRLVSLWHPALLVVCHADGGTITVPDPSGDHHPAPSAANPCPLCQLGWAPPPAVHHVAVLADAPVHGALPALAEATPAPAWTPQSPRAPPAASV